MAYFCHVIESMVMNGLIIGYWYIFLDDFWSLIASVKILTEKSYIHSDDEIFFMKSKH
jgi:hypothetical protein